MFTTFRLNKPIGEAYNMDLDDALKTKKVLAGLGHLEEAGDGLDEYPDRPMLDAVEAFQRDAPIAAHPSNAGRRRRHEARRPDGPKTQ
ncbi:MAG: hypothetical protein VW268_09445 [Rhodospirillaceae bacterium]